MRFSGEGNGSIATGRRERSCLRQQCIADDGSCTQIAVREFGTPQPITAIKVLEITALCRKSDGRLRVRFDIWQALPPIQRKLAIRSDKHWTCPQHRRSEYRSWRRCNHHPRPGKMNLTAQKTEAVHPQPSLERLRSRPQLVQLSPGKNNSLHANPPRQWEPIATFPNLVPRYHL